jgi:hypothetical protein
VGGASRVWSWADERLVSTFDALHVLEQRVVAAQLVLLREIDGRGLGRRLGGASSAAWLRNRHRLNPATASRRVKLAAALDADLPRTAAALADGSINVEQAQAIADAVVKLPTGLRPEGEQRLLEHADRTDPRTLAAAGARLLEDLDPEEAERQAEDREQRLAARAHRARDFRMIDVPGTGLVRIAGQLDQESAAVLRTGLDALCSPRNLRDGATTSRTAGQIRADAVVEIFRIALACRDLPENGGERPQVVVTVPLRTLQEDLGVAALEDGGALTAAAARRLACDAKVIPIVLGGPGQVLDAGRSQRLFTGPLRRALVVRDGGCVFPDCDRPPRWCEGHHVRSWVHGGPTSLGNAVLVCAPHHRLLHEGDWQARINPEDGLPEFIPPPYIDLEQRPQRNIRLAQRTTYHRRD